ncbi:MAG: imidazolonepropionase [Candidatus Izimaplasma sp.]|nr:imidazolonepropionase [Candidatus Izimaplasma bacterium]
MNVDTKIINIKHIYTPLLPAKSYQIQKIDDVEIAIKDGIIVAIENDLSQYQATTTLDANYKVVLPGFIDGHTHLVHGGSREHEFDLKLQGVSYMDILKQGGGILSTVTATKKATFDELLHKASNSLDRMLEFGVTSIEAKSGYGLDTDIEIKQLEVNKALHESHPIDIYSTYLKAHAIPPAFKDQKHLFMQSVLDDMVIIKSKNLAKSVDIFCEEGVFDANDTLSLCDKANALNFDIRIHTDEIKDIGGTEIALNHQAKSIDHLIVMSDENIKKAAQTNTLCNLLPSTSFYLNKAYAKGRKMIDMGCLVGISSDYNPGSTPSENLQFSMHLAALKMGLTPHEILVAVTLNPAISLGIEDQVGQVKVGKQADLVMCQIPNLEYMIYHYGINHVTDVFKKGRHVIKNKHILKEDLQWL